MAIQSSINSLLSQAQSLAAFYKGFKKAGDLIKGQDDIIKGQEAQTEASQNLLKSFEERFKEYKGIPSDVVLNPEQQDIVNIGTELEEGMGRAVDIGGAEYIHNKTKKMGFKNIAEREAAEDEAFMSHIKNEVARVVAERDAKKRLDSAIEAQSPNSELKNELARKVAKISVKSRTNSINQSKSDFNEHTASLIKKYGKGSENP